MNTFYLNGSGKSEVQTPDPPADLPNVRDEQILLALDRGKRLRARLFRRVVRRVWQNLTSTGARRPPRALAPGLDHHLLSALSAIRSSAELLRDNPDIAPADRRRFADIVLKEEARLEGLIGKILKPTGPTGR